MPRTAALAALLIAAAPAAAAPDLSPRDRGDLAIRARGILKRYCADCHGDKPRRGDVSVLDHGKLTAPAYPVALVNPADPPRSLLLELVRDGSMPPGGRPRPTADEIKTLADWVATGAPGYPTRFDDRFAADAAFADWQTQYHVDKPAMRYLSFAHLLGDGAPAPNLRDAETKLRAALQRASGKKDVPLAAADPAATVFRLDLRTAGWDRGDLFDRVEKGGPRNNAHPLTAFDVILLEYPFAGDATWIGDPGKNLPRLAGARKVPVVSADWLADALAPTAPLTADVRALVDLLAPGDPPCGPRPRPFFAGPAVGRPLEAWYAADPDGGFTAEVVSGDDFSSPTPELKARHPHKLRVTTDRPLRLRALRVLADGHTTPQPLERDTIPAGKTTLGPRANVPFVASVTGDGDSETDYFVLFVSEAEVPVPTILLSRHNPLCEDRTRHPISRFLFEPTDPTFDRSRLLRRVVPVTVRQ